MKPCGAVGPRPVALEVHEASSWAEITLHWNHWKPQQIEKQY